MKRIIPKKSLGQNFLKDEEVVRKILEAAELNSENSNVIEIGPGTGVLTKELIKRSKRVIAIEKDDELAKLLKNSISSSNFRVINKDILEVNLPEFIKESNFCEYSLVANIPYYITGKILRLFLSLDNLPRNIVLLIQKEVAERICLKKGKKSVLSIVVQYFGKPEIISKVPRESFWPVPKVDSAILKIKCFRKSSFNSDSVRDIEDFFKLVKAGFLRPRKTLINNLTVGTEFDKECLREIFKEINFNLKFRPGELSIEQWKDLKYALDNY